MTRRKVRVRVSRAGLRRLHRVRRLRAGSERGSRRVRRVEDERDPRGPSLAHRSEVHGSQGVASSRHGRPIPAWALCRRPQGRRTTACSPTSAVAGRTPHPRESALTRTTQTTPTASSWERSPTSAPTTSGFDYSQSGGPVEIVGKGAGQTVLTGPSGTSAAAAPLRRRRSLGARPEDQHSGQRGERVRRATTDDTARRIDVMKAEQQIYDHPGVYLERRRARTRTCGRPRRPRTTASRPTLAAGGCPPFLDLRVLCVTTMAGRSSAPASSPRARVVGGDDA